MPTEDYYHRCAWCGMFVHRRAEKIIRGLASYYLHPEDEGYCKRSWLAREERMKENER